MVAVEPPGEGAPRLESRALRAALEEFRLGRVASRAARKALEFSAVGAADLEGWPVEDWLVLSAINPMARRHLLGPRPPAGGRRADDDALRMGARCLAMGQDPQLAGRAAWARAQAGALRGEAAASPTFGSAATRARLATQLSATGDRLDRRQAAWGAWFADLRPAGADEIIALADIYLEAGRERWAPSLPDRAEIGTATSSAADLISQVRGRWHGLASAGGRLRAARHRGPPRSPLRGAIDAAGDAWLIRSLSAELQKQGYLMLRLHDQVENWRLCLDAFTRRWAAAAAALCVAAGGPPATDGPKPDPAVADLAAALARGARRVARLSGPAGWPWMARYVWLRDSIASYQASRCRLIRAGRRHSAQLRELTNEVRDFVPIALSARRLRAGPTALRTIAEHDQRDIAPAAFADIAEHIDLLDSSWEDHLGLVSTQVAYLDRIAYRDWPRAEPDGVQGLGAALPARWQTAAPRRPDSPPA